MADGFAIVQTNEMSNATVNFTVEPVLYTPAVSQVVLSFTGAAIVESQTGGGGGGYEPLPPEDNMVWGWGA